MKLDQPADRTDFLGIVLRQIEPSLGAVQARAIAEELLESTEIVPAKGKTLSDVIAAFDAVPVGAPARFEIYPSFLRQVDPYVHISLTRFARCLNADAPPLASPPPQGPTCWSELFDGYSPEYKLNWAYAQLEKAQRLDRARRRSGEAPLPRRYVIGRSYGSLFFVGHPYPGFLDAQIWMTPDCRLFWINERDCLLEAFRTSVVSSKKAIILGVALIAVGGAVATAALAAPLALAAGRAVVTWTLMNPTVAFPLMYTGVEVVFSIATGVDIPPTSPYDEMAFLGVSGVRKVGNVAIECVTEVVERNGTQLRVVVREASLAGSESFVRYGGGKYLLQITRTTSSLIPAAKVPSITASTLEALSKAGADADLLQRIVNSGDELIISAANRFRGIANIKRVLSEALSGSKKKVQGARFALAYALSRIPESDVDKAIAFEFRSITQELRGAGAAADQTEAFLVRYADLLIMGERVELKSVKKVSSALVHGPKNELGELERDLLQKLGTKPEDAFAQVKRLKWVFDGSILDAKYTKEMIAEDLYRYLTGEGLKSKNATSRLFYGWKRNDELRSILLDMVEIFPPR